MIFYVFYYTLKFNVFVLFNINLKEDIRDTWAGVLFKSEIF